MLPQTTQYKLVSSLNTCKALHRAFGHEKNNNKKINHCNSKLQQPVKRQNIPWCELIRTLPFVLQGISLQGAWCSQEASPQPQQGSQDKSLLTSYSRKHLGSLSFCTGLHVNKSVSIQSSASSGSFIMAFGVMLSSFLSGTAAATRSFL